MDKRRFPRINLKINVELSVEENKRLYRCQLVNISVSGALLKILEPQPQYSMISQIVKFFLKTDDSDVKFEGKVVREFVENNHHFIAVNFIY